MCNVRQQRPNVRQKRPNVRQKRPNVRQKSVELSTGPLYIEFQREKKEKKVLSSGPLYIVALLYIKFYKTGDYYV